MHRVVCLTAALVAAAALSVPAQNRTRIDDFGRADWCAEDRDRNGSRSECRILEETVRETGTIDVDASQNGGIRVRGWDRDDVSIRVKVVAWDRSAARAREVVDRVRLETSGGRIRAAAGRDDDRWSASFALQVPRRARLELRAHNGGLALAAFDGTAVMRTVNGGLSLESAGGDIQARTQNGGVRVRLDGRRWDGRGLDVETRNGGVTVDVPDGYSAQLETGTMNGGLRIDFPITLRSGLVGRRVSTTLGSGGAPIRVLTTNGGVMIRRR